MFNCSLTVPHVSNLPHLFAPAQVRCDAIVERSIKFVNLGTGSDRDVDAESQSYLSTSSTRYGALLEAERGRADAERGRADAERGRADAERGAREQAVATAAAERAGREFAERIALMAIQGSQLNLLPRP